MKKQHIQTQLGEATDHAEQARLSYILALRLKKAPKAMSQIPDIFRPPAGASLSYADYQAFFLDIFSFPGSSLSYADYQAFALELPPVPVIPHIDAAILKEINGHKMEMSAWHSSCGTTHCRGGFAIFIAGEAGAELERKTNSHFAARLIYEASRPGMMCPDFHASNEAAMKDLRACAEMDPLP